MTSYDIAVSAFVVFSVFISQGAVFLGGMAAQRMLDHVRKKCE